MSVRVADGDCHLHHHCAVDGHCCHRVVSATDHLRVADAMNAMNAMNAMMRHLLADGLHAEGAKNGVKCHPEADVRNGVMCRLSADDLHVANAMSAVRHLVFASPLHDRDGVPFCGQVQNQNAAFDLAYPFLHDLYWRVPSPTAHHF